MLSLAVKDQIVRKSLKQKWSYKFENLVITKHQKKFYVLFKMNVNDSFNSSSYWNMISFDISKAVWNLKSEIWNMS